MKIHYAYYLNVVVRLVLEAVFIYLAYGLFKFMVSPLKASYS